MKVAIVSDIHDNILKLEKMINFLKEIDADGIIFLGDLVSPFVIKFIGNIWEKKFWGVFGNNEGDVGVIKDFSLKFENIDIEGKFRILKIKDLEIAIMHEPLHLKFVPENVKFIFYGHTHKVDVKEEKGRLIINPGELCGWLTGKSTFVIFDFETLNFAFKEVK
ncbi:metallophosphoesterase [Candidatus Woesearchaeota archaeon]|nr:MAG: metallophosphoesterase [Candidatus Woesearchaeota archaeon]